MPLNGEKSPFDPHWNLMKMKREWRGKAWKTKAKHTQAGRIYILERE